MPPSEGSDDPDDDPLTKLKSAIVLAKGKSVFVETTAGSFGGDTRDAPRQDWVQKRLGAIRPKLWRDCSTARRRKCWRPAALTPFLRGCRRATGTLAREAYRRFERMTLGPLARIVESELAAKLDAPSLALSFDSLRASDFAGIARGLKAMLESGLTKEQVGKLLDLGAVEDQAGRRGARNEVRRA